MPVKYEIFNDIDPRVINWWEQVRTHPEEFAWHVQGCPHSRTLHEWAVQAQDDGDLSDFDRAIAFHVIALQSVAQNLGRKKPHWSRAITSGGKSSWRWRSERVMLLAERFSDVCLKCGRAEKLFSCLVDNEMAVIYVDPPYYSADTESYRFNEQNTRVLSNLLLAQQGRVAISGYGDEWDLLGWNRYELEGITTVANKKKGENATVRTEILWTNYDAQIYGSKNQTRQPSLF